MSAATAEARLRAALTANARTAAVAINVRHWQAAQWASATFAGARHEVVLALVADDAAERWLEELPEAELALPGHLVADLKLVALTQAEREMTVTLEVLTVEDR